MHRPGKPAGAGVAVERGEEEGNKRRTIIASFSQHNIPKEYYLTCLQVKKLKLKKAE